MAGAGISDGTNCCFAGVGVGFGVAPGTTGTKSESGPGVVDGACVGVGTKPEVSAGVVEGRA